LISANFAAPVLIHLPFELKVMYAGVMNLEPELADVLAARIVERNRLRDIFYINLVQRKLSW
jgi:hypothetical protein